jgi:hypothetical protein
MADDVNNEMGDLGRVVARFVAGLRERNPDTPEFAARLDVFVRGRALALVPCEHTRETWPHQIAAFAVDGEKLVVFHVAPGSADGGASVLADDDGVEVAIKDDTPLEVASYLRRIAGELEAVVGGAGDVETKGASDHE